MTMKKILAPALLLAASLCAAAQQYQSPDIARLLREDRSRAAVNTYPYAYVPERDTPAPKGYRPFYISHYGRHGSRSDWGPGTYAHLRDVLAAAQDAGLLTPAGDTLKTAAGRIYDLHDGMDGRLTPRGGREHRGIAERMYRRFPEVFRHGHADIRAVSSTVPRCIISMTAFTDRLTELSPALEISWDTGETYMAYINNSYTDPIRIASQALLDSLDRAYTPDTLYVMRRLFTDPEAARGIVGDPIRLENEIFLTARIAAAFDLGEDLFACLPFDAVYKGYEQLAMNLYLRHCNSVAFGADRLPLAAPLVQDIVDKADAAIRDGGPDVDLRFGHDFPILALFSILGLEGVGDRLTLHEAQERWYGTGYIPFAANLQMVFYRDRRGDVLIKCLVNEHETLLKGLVPVTGPYYRWTEVRERIHPCLSSSSSR